ncbi:MAG: hypothetical protein EOP24_34535 [Hyphomicrobiales bacterium]|nr:MAG: hypothetical protein EOP24_34535 [Hyphomicrobiales bacterium]
MTTITHPALPVYRPGMADVGLALLRAFRAHWAAHHNAYPQKVILTAQQAIDLHESRLLGQVATPGEEPAPHDSFLGRPIEINEATLGEVIAHDGTVMHLSNFMPDSIAPTK